MKAFPTHIVAVAGFVEDGLGNVLLVENLRRGWEFPGGQVETGENLPDALTREIREESGIETEVVRLVGIYSNTGRHPGYDGYDLVPTKLMLDFVCRARGGTLRGSAETAGSAWVPKEQALERIQTLSYRTRFEAYLRCSGDISYVEYVTHPAFQIKQERKI